MILNQHNEGVFHLDVYGDRIKMKNKQYTLCPDQGIIRRVIDDEEYNLIRIGFLFCSLLNCARYTEMIQITMPHCSVLEPRRFTKRNSTAGGEIQNDSNLEYNYDQITYNSQLHRILLSSYTQAPMQTERALPQVAHVSKDLVVSTLVHSRNASDCIFCGCYLHPV